jgi:hypothetical protein
MLRAVLFGACHEDREGGIVAGGYGTADHKRALGALGEQTAGAEQQDAGEGAT